MFKAYDAKTIYFDVDDTLVEWLKPNDERMDTHPDVIHGLCTVYSHLPIVEHIEELKRLKEEGKTIVVWSQGGSDWAETVVMALGLIEHVDVCLTKPAYYYDDFICDVWIGKRRYIGPPHLMK